MEEQLILAINYEKPVKICLAHGQQTVVPDPIVINLFQAAQDVAG
jgi:hypothetical protein